MPSLPLAQIVTPLRCIPPQNRSVCFVHQIEVGFFFQPLHGWRGVLKRQPSSLSETPHITPAPHPKSPSRHSHPLVTERGGGPVNYRQVPHSEQWCIHSACSTTSAFLHRPRHKLNLSDDFPIYQNPVEL